MKVFAPILIAFAVGFAMGYAWKPTVTHEIVLPSPLKPDCPDCPKPLLPKVPNP